MRAMNVVVSIIYKCMPRITSSGGKTPLHYGGKKPPGASRPTREAPCPTMYYIILMDITEPTTTVTSSPDRPLPSPSSPDRPLPSPSSPDGPLTSHSSPDGPLTSHSSPDGPLTSHSSPNRPLTSHSSPDGPLTSQSSPDGP